MPWGGVYKSYLIGSLVFFFSFIISAIAASALTPVSDTSAQVVSVENRATGYFITVDSPDTATLEITPTPSGTTSTSSASTINVLTNAPLGYKLYISAESVNLSPSDPNIPTSFSPTSSSTPTTLSSNSWGYSLDTTESKNWTAITNTETNIASSNQSNYPTGTNTNVYYGINANTEMLSGTYSTTVTYTAIAEGVPEEHFMQEFTVSDCANKSVDENFYLIDQRDRKIYKMVKARDGNCYMAENLKYQNVESSNWTGNIYADQLLHIEDGSYYYNYTSAINVCPSGWTLPSGEDVNTNGSWAHLMNVYGFTTGAELLAQTSLGYNGYDGYYNSNTGSVAEKGSYASYWSINSLSADRAANFGFNSSTVGPQNGNIKGFGFSVRCVFQPKMQDFTLAECDNITTDKNFILTDTRNNKAYKIVKARDGNCWMADNLAIYGQTISSADSNLPANTNITLPASSNWSGNNYTSATLHAATTTEYEGTIYYNWCAITGLSGASCATTAQYTYDICPKGWQLPNAGDKNTNKSYAKLIDSYNITTVNELINTSQLGITKFYGTYHPHLTKEDGQGVSGALWTSTPSANEYEAYNLAYHYNINPTNASQKGYGYPVRCVFNYNPSTDSPTLANITTMQQITPSICSNSTLEKSYYLFDSRDSKIYRTAKLKDGNCWMQQNLALDGGRTLTSVDSDVTSNYSLTTDSVNTEKATSTDSYGNTYGNYYGWTTARAGGSNEVNADPNKSLCPKGWKYGQYVSLASAYGITRGTSSSDVIRIQSPPLSLPAAGIYYTSWANVGVSGEYPSDHTHPSNTSYSSGTFHFDTNTGGIEYTGNTHKAVMTPMRCLAPGV